MLMVQHVRGYKRLYTNALLQSKVRVKCSHLMIVSTRVYLLIVDKELMLFSSVQKHISKQTSGEKNLRNAHWIHVVPLIRKT